MAALMTRAAGSATAPDHRRPGADARIFVTAAVLVTTAVLATAAVFVTRVTGAARPGRGGAQPGAARIVRATGHRGIRVVAAQSVLGGVMSGLECLAGA